MRSAAIVEYLKQIFTSEDLMTHPVSGYSTVRRIGNNKIESFVFGVSGHLDGTVNVYHKGFICVKWEYGRRPYSKTFHSKEEVVEWAKERDWLA
tara:strand:- start:1242 stop:1523 length:282 start_codon:yes stop_codon:yes gene_type:complete